MLPRGHRVHASPGRLRLRIPEKKGDAAFFARVRDLLASCPVVKEVGINPHTGSILLHYSEGQLPAIAALAAEQNLFHLVTAWSPRAGRPLNVAVRGAYRLVDSSIRRLSGGNLDLPETTVLALVGSGAYQLLRGRVVALPWYVAFWYGLSVYLMPKAKHLLEEAAEGPLEESSGPNA